MWYGFQQNVIIDMKSMLNNAIKGDYMADNGPSVSVSAYSRSQCGRFWQEGFQMVNFTDALIPTHYM